MFFTQAPHPVGRFRAMHDETKLAEMLCTRLCHDLTGPIGAVNNGAEFLGEEGFDMQNEAVQLILSSALEAVNRLQFYRQAYGRISESGEVSLLEKKQLAQLYFSAGKITLDWPDAHADASGVSISAKTARLLLNLLVIAAHALIRGGTVSVRVEHGENDTKQFSVRASGQTIKLDAETRDILAHRTDVPLTPKTAQAYLTSHLAQEVDASLRLVENDGSLEFACSQRNVLALVGMH
jgi:histidine phosphotransferase ChpT